MPKLLSITASPRGDYSVSRSLTASFVEEWKKNHGGEVVSRDLYQTKLPFVDLPWIAGAYSPAEKHSPEMKDALKISDELIAELEAADHIVIGTPMYNFSIPAILKAWIDHIVRIDKTFTAKYEGLLKNKKAFILIASGGDYKPGSYMEQHNLESNYMKQILGFVGITDVTVILQGNTTDVMMGKISQDELVAQAKPEIVTAAA